MNQPEGKGGFFRQGGPGQYILAGVADFMARRNGEQPMMAPMLMGQVQQQQAAAAEAAAAQRKRAMDLADYETKKGIDARYRVESPDSFEKALAGAGIDPASPEGQALYRGRAESMARDPNDEFVVVPIPGRGTYAGPRSGLADAMGAPQSAPQGVTFTPLDDGGPASAPGGFRP